MSTPLKTLSVQEFAESGLLFEINRRVMWPLGYALAVVKMPGADGPIYRIHGVIDMEEVVVPSADEDDVNRLRTFLAWSRDRVEALEAAVKERSA